MAIEFANLYNSSRDCRINAALLTLWYCEIKAELQTVFLEVFPKLESFSFNFSGPLTINETQPLLIKILNKEQIYFLQVSQFSRNFSGPPFPDIYKLLENLRIVSKEIENVFRILRGESAL